MQNTASKAARIRATMRGKQSLGRTGRNHNEDGWWDATRKQKNAAVVVLLLLLLGTIKVILIEICNRL
jgi:hypothetical protein